MSGGQEPQVLGVEEVDQVVVDVVVPEEEIEVQESEGMLLHHFSRTQMTLLITLILSFQKTPDGGSAEGDIKHGKCIKSN